MKNFEKEEKKALVQFLGIKSTKEISNSYTDHLYEYNNEEYWVSDYDTAYDRAIEECTGTFKDLGITAVTKETAEYLINNSEYCYYDWESDVHEMNLNYAENISSERASDSRYASRLIEEAIAKNIISEDDCFENESGELDYEDIDTLVEDFATKEDENFQSASDFFFETEGRNWINTVPEFINSYLNYRACAEYVVDEDGIANTLAYYDGKENTEEVNDTEYYIYRRN